MSKVVVAFLNGPQGVGKGFTFEELGRRYPSIQRVGMSALFRAHRAANGPYTKALVTHMDVKKDLVPSWMTIKILEQDLNARIGGLGEETIYIAIEGFPRNPDQAENIATSLIQKPEVVLVQFVLKAAPGVADSNAANRNRGPDDSPEGRTVRQRIYETETMPAIDVLKTKFGVSTFVYEGGSGDMYIDNAQNMAAVMFGLGGEV